MKRENGLLVQWMGGVVMMAWLDPDMLSVTRPMQFQGVERLGQFSKVRFAGVNGCNSSMI